MAKIVEMDERITLEKQLDEDTGPIVFMNKFSVNPNDVDEFLKRWAAFAAEFKKQPGFISAQLHRGIAGSGIFINYNIWE
jgi:heme-degrading monooxygenase HmoA